MTNQTIPLALLADAWQVEPDVLASQLGDAIITDALRVKHVPVTAAIALLAQRDAEDARHRQASEARNAELARESNARIARVRAIQDTQQAQRAAGVIDSSTTALAAMCMADTNTALDAAGSRFDELLTAARKGDYGVMHRYTPTNHQET